MHIARLGHEAVDHAVKDHVVIIAALGQRNDLFDMLGRHIGQKVDDDLALGAAIDGDGQVRAGAVFLGKRGGRDQRERGDQRLT